MKIQPGIYTLKEFFDLLNITSYTWKKRKEDLLAHLKDYFDYTIELGGYHNTEQTIVIKEVYDDYEPLPRKTCTKEKQEDYKEFALKTIQHYPLNTTTNIARRAITDEYLQNKWHHKRAAAENYIRPVVKDNNLICKDHKQWCKLNKELNIYEPLTEEQYIYFKALLQHLSSNGGVENIAEVVSLYNEGEISREEYEKLVSDVVQMEFQFILGEFCAKYGFIPVKVPYLIINGF